MKINFALAVAAVALVAQTDAASISWLDGPYEFLDKVVMTFYKPLIWYIVIGWSQNLACDFVIDNFLDEFITVNDLTDDEQTTICKEGIQTYWEQFFYGGDVAERPYDLGWYWDANEVVTP